jgi:hypothetical protein
MSPEHISRIDILPRDKRGKISWSSLKGDPELVQGLIEAEALHFIETGQELTQANLSRNGLNSLTVAVSRFYPGRLTGLKNKLGIPQKKKPNGYWTSPSGREEFVERVRTFVQKEGSISAPLLEEKDRHLLHLVFRVYSGGLRQILFDLEVSLKRPRGFWTPERILEEAERFYRDHGRISHDFLSRNNEPSLGNAIRSYPGGIHQLKKDLGIKDKRKPKGYWTREQIEEQSRSFVEKEGKLDRQTLYAKGLASLDAAIGSSYPGGMSALRSKLGLVEQTQITPTDANIDLERLLEVDNVSK